MKLKMERVGQFTVKHTGDNSTQCGILGQEILSYKVILETSDKYLDKDGFIIDNNQVHKYFVDKYSSVGKFVSCELIASQACRDFRKLMPNLFGISVSISGNPAAAWLTAHWNRAEELVSDKTKSELNQSTKLSSKTIKQIKETYSPKSLKTKVDVPF